MGGDASGTTPAGGCQIWEVSTGFYSIFIPTDLTSLDLCLACVLPEAAILVDPQVREAGRESSSDLSMITVVVLC